ncbi:MAG: lamin tail domain-containing protein [Verrucomicrobiales bacterium]
MNYNPGDSADAEFIELKNIGADPLDISGVAFTDGVNFTFANGTVINGGEHILIARQRAAFEALYGNNLPLAGEYAPDALSNGGESIELRTAEGIIIQRFTFDDAWYVATDGEGFSLVAVDPTAPVANWNEATQWAVSTSPGGSPGVAETLKTSTYALWLSEHFSLEEIADPAVTGPEAIVNAAGIPNLLKYAFALNPRDDSQSQLHPDILPTGQIVSFYRRARATDLQFSFESSIDMITWSPVATALVASDPTSENAELVTWHISDATIPHFIRVRVSFR